MHGDKFKKGVVVDDDDDDDDVSKLAQLPDSKVKGVFPQQPWTCSFSLGEEGHVQGLVFRFLMSIVDSDRNPFVNFFIASARPAGINIPF